MGTLDEAQPDMWYLEGRWTPADTPAAREFEALASTLDTKLVYKDPTKGTRVLLLDENESAPGDTHALVLSLTDGQLCLRRVLDPEAVEWLIANVK